MLSPDAVPEYIAGRPLLAAEIDPRTLQVTEVGDGNLNLVFVCTDANGCGLVLKQALPYVRLVGPDWPMTEQRAEREAAALRVHSGLSNDVCRLIDFDADEHVLALEDLSDHDVLRSRLNDGGAHDGIAHRMGVFIADVAFGTSFLALGEEEFRLRAAAAVNPDLCAITEDLILTEPFLGADRNSVRPGIQPDVNRLQSDTAWIEAAMTMKYRFLTTQEALIHGDLHTGSVFVRDVGDNMSVKTFDSEFACYGPIGFDVGLLWANMFVAGARAAALGEHNRAADLFNTLPAIWAAFCDRFDQHWPQRRAPEKYPESFRIGWLKQIYEDAIGFAGCEAARRVIGLAKVSDVETLDDAPYETATRSLLTWSHTLLLQRSTLTADALAKTAVSALEASTS